MASSHRKKTVGKRTTTESSSPKTKRLREENAVLRIQASTSGPPRRQHSRGQVANSRPEPESIHPEIAGAIPETYNVRPHEPHTPMPQAPREESSDSTYFSTKRQRDRKSQLSNSMRARLGPQEPGRPRPPTTTTWAARPDPVVTPMVRNVHSHLVVQQVGRNLLNEPPIGSISKRLGRHALHALLLSHHSLRAPKEIPCTKIFHIRWGPAIPSIILCIIDSS
ncbi:hypothetical protein CK203_079282 [Vitis vinifera]|uniref:Uncharacterized protein n=1 Tax=Vitis vinifera TaxID=29760 RepID=A0A438FBF9_VITVI|nr:hypothetical protein CK203_079282 [Vitis vinifera]